MVSHWEEDLATWATQANRQAGGVAKTSLDKRAKDKTVETTAAERILDVLSECWLLGVLMIPKLLQITLLIRDFK